MLLVVEEMEAVVLLRDEVTEPLRTRLRSISMSVSLLFVVVTRKQRLASCFRTGNNF